MTIDTIQRKSRPAEIMLVEDNPGDVLLTRKAFSRGKIANNITVATDGEMAVSMLRKDSPYADVSTPDIILLDINLPKLSGKDVLRIIKSDMTLRHIPVIIMTSSMSETDVIKSYNLHANGYIVKPVSLDKFADVISSIELFWFTLVVMPDAADMEKKEEE